MITVIFGEPGAGKTAYLTALALKYLGNTKEAYDLKRNCIQQVRSFNEQGFNYSIPDRSPVYSNYPVSAHVGYKKYIDSYYIDGFHMGMENEFVPIIPLLPGSKVFLTEVQRYYNSRLVGELPAWVSHFFEEHRHYYLDLFLDLQRLSLLDLSIRGIAGRIVQVVGVQHKTDYIGNVLESEFTLREWHDTSSAEAFINNNNLENYELIKEKFSVNVFEAYKSRSFFDAFLPKEDFMLLDHVGNVVNGVDLNFVKAIYRQTAPYGYYNSEAKAIMKARKDAEEKARKEAAKKKGKVVA